MYRIKNKDNFKELLKYGYKECENEYTKKVMKDTNKVWAYYETIEISKDDGIIRTRLYQDCANQEWVGYIEKKGRFIYDLDKAGLLEEVNIERLDDVKVATLVFDFGKAMQYLKRGKKVQREGWNGKNQYIELATSISYKNSNDEIINAEHDAIGNKAIAFVGTSGVQIGWLASQADMLAEDWKIVEEK